MDPVTIPCFKQLYADIVFDRRKGVDGALGFVLLIQTDPQDEPDNVAQTLFRFRGHVIEKQNFIPGLTERLYRIESIDTAESAEEMFCVHALNTERVLMFLAVLLEKPVQCHVSRRLSRKDHKGIAVGIELAQDIEHPIVAAGLFRKFELNAIWQEWHRVIGTWLIGQLKAISGTHQIALRMEIARRASPYFKDAMFDDEYFIN